MDAQNLYRTHLQDIKLMQLATVGGNRPWLCSVWFAADENDCIYWISRDTRRHSIEVKTNPNVACTFQKHYEGGLGEKGQALVIAGKAEKLSGIDCDTPYNLYAARYPQILEFQSKEDFLNDRGHHYFYKLTPKEIVLWDDVNFPDDPRQVIQK